MRSKHGWPLAFVVAALLLPPPALAQPKRVVSTFLCTDEYVFRLLPRHDIAALSFEAADRHPVVSTIANDVGDIPLVHNSAEEVLARNPDLVVMYAGTQERLHAQLHDAGKRVIDVPWANSLADIRAITLNLGREIGAEDRARALVEKMDRALDRAKSPGPPVRTLLYQANGYTASDPVTNEILRDAGLLDVAHEMGVTRSGTIPLELLVESPPDLLLLSSSDSSRPSLASFTLAHPALTDLARRTVVGRASLTPLYCPGPWSAAVASTLAFWGDRARALARTGTRP